VKIGIGLGLVVGGAVLLIPALVILLQAAVTDMRVRLDENRYELSTFTYFFLYAGIKIQVSFKIDDEAEAFAQKFDGSLVDRPWTADQLITMG
jgi:hypothetical protein